MTAHAASTAHIPQPFKATGLSSIRPVHKEVEYDSEAETLVGGEFDDDDDAHTASPNNQLPTGHGAAGWTSANEPCGPTGDNLDAAIRGQKVKEMEDEGQRSLSLIAGATVGESKTRDNLASKTHGISFSDNDLRESVDDMYATKIVESAG